MLPMTQERHGQETQTSPEGIRGVLVVCAGSPGVGGLVASLARDAIELEVGTVGSTPPAHGLIVAWLPANAGESVLAGLVAWRRTATVRTHLIGCAPEGAAIDSERALAAGFDDFMAGRSSPRELSARLRALLRRYGTARAGGSGGGGVAERTHFGRLVLDSARRELWITSSRGDGRAVVPLTTLEHAAVGALMAAGGRTLSREELLDRVWGSDELEVGLRAVDNLVCRLRRKLRDKTILVTVRGIGFRLADR